MTNPPAMGGARDPVADPGYVEALGCRLTVTPIPTTPTTPLYEGLKWPNLTDYGWEHKVLLETLVPAKPGGRYPLGGARARPPEDCGGTGGCKQLVDTLADPGTTPDHHDLLQWLDIDKGTDFDPARFDRAAADRRLDAVVLAAIRTD